MDSRSITPGGHRVVVGVDPDVYRLAYCVFRDGQYRAHSTIARSAARGGVLDDWEVRLWAWAEQCRRHGAVVFLEGIYLPADRKKANVRGFAALAEVQGEIKAALRGRGVAFAVTGASTWQSAVLGFTKDRAKLKAASKAVALPLIGRPLSDHEADATCIALYGTGFRLAAKKSA